MKRKILSLVLSMTLVLAYAVPVAAAETGVPANEAPAAEAVIAEETPEPAAAEAVVPNTADSADKVSDDPEVQKAYDTYLALEKALADGDIAALEDAYNYLNDIEFETDSQQDEYDKIVEEMIGFEDFLVTTFSAAYVVDANDKYEAYLADKNAGTAYNFVVAFDAVTEDCELNMEDFVPGISADYEDAKANYMASENVLTVYNAYSELTAALEALEIGFYDEDFVNACKNFEAVLDVFNELTEEEFADLAVMLGVADGEEAFNVILSDWINANLALELGALYDAYLNDPTVETAAEFVEYYETLLNDTDLLTEEDKAVILTAFTFTYEDAKSLLAEADNAPSDDAATENTTGVTDKSDKDASPATGDDFNATPYAALMVIAAAVAGLAVKRRGV